MRKPSHGRAWLLLAAGAVAALLWLGALFALWQVRADARVPAAPILPRPSSLPNSLQPQPSPAGDRTAIAVGINLEAEELAGERLHETLDQLQRSGVTWLRFTLPWDKLEPSPGQYDWSWTDRVFAALAERPGLTPLIVLDRTPAWARAGADAGNPLAPPRERADFGAFVSAVARRYGDQAQYYQIWHEPNIAPHWGARPVDPAGYLGLLREAALQLRAVDDDAVIVAAALAPTTETGGANLSDISYLDDLYNLGAREWFDVVAAEPYGFSQPADERPDRATLNYRRVELLRQVMERHGDISTPLWAASFGWNSLPQNWGGASRALAPWGQVSEAEQTEYLTDALDLAQAGWSWDGPLFWAALCPQRPGGDPWIGFALCRSDGSLRPAWQVLAEFAAKPPVMPAGNHRVDHPALRYTSRWRVTPDAADPSADGDTLTMRFRGADLALRVQGGPYWALYRISVDGQPANALPRDESGAAYLVLYDPLSELRVVPVASGLSPGEHEARLVATGGWGQWALRGVLVSDGSRNVSAAVAWLLLVLAGAVTAVWIVLAWPWRKVVGEVSLPGPCARPGCTERAGGVVGAGFAGQLGVRIGLVGRTSRLAGWPDRWFWAAGAILLAVLALSRWMPLDLVILAGLGILFLVRPESSLPLIAFSIPFWPRPHTLARWEFSLYEILIWLAVAAAVARWAVAALANRWQATRDFAPQTSRDLTGETKASAAHRFLGRIACSVRGLDWPVLALLAAGLVATIAAERQDVAIREYRTVFVVGVLFYWLITRVPMRSGDRFSPWPLLDGLTLGGVVVSGLALWQLITGQGRVDVEGVWRVRALYGSPNNLALFLDRTLPLAVAVAAFGCGSKERRVLYAAAVALMAAASVATFSKGALLLGLPVGLALVLVGGAWRARRRWPLGLLAALLVGAGLALVRYLRTPRFASLLDLRSGTSALRLKLWAGTWRMALDHPWLGVGPDNFLYAYRSRYVLPSAWQELNLSHPHNVVLDLWTRLGIGGLVAGGWAMIAGMGAGWRLFRFSSAEMWPAFLGLLGGLGATLAHGLIDNSLFLVDLMALFMLALGVFQRSGAGVLRMDEG